MYSNPRDQAPDSESQAQDWQSVLSKAEEAAQSLSFPNLEFQGVLGALPVVLKSPVADRPSSPPRTSLATLSSGSGGGRPTRHDARHEKLYSVRIPKSPKNVLCVTCQQRFFASGPTGFVEDDPICDECLLLASEGLGMLLALSALTRTFGSLKGASREEYSEALAELAAFARIYESIAARSGPLRSFKISDLEN